MAWNLEGTYFETCSCEVVCPCTASLALGADYDRCRVALVFNITNGDVEGTDVSASPAVVAVVGLGDPDPGVAETAPVAGVGRCTPATVATATVGVVEVAAPGTVLPFAVAPQAVRSRAMPTPTGASFLDIRPSPSVVAACWRAF